MSRIVLKFLNGIYGWMIGIVIMVSTIYACYSIWDNAQIYHAAEAIQNLVRELKPDEKAEDKPTFEDLRKINEDVIGWITVDGTNIDYPVLQGETNLTYMNKDVYGDFSLAGSIFLDTRNEADFSGNYSLIYGHNMDEHLMFGDLAMFKEKDFFKENTTATLMLPGEVRKMEVAAVLQLSAGTEEIFNPDKWEDGLSGFGAFLEENSIWYHSEITKRLRTQPDSVKVVTMVTCSNGDTNDRTALTLTHGDPNRTSHSVTGDSRPGKTNGGSEDGSDINGTGLKKTGDSQDPKFWIYVIIGTLAFILLFEGIERFASKYRE